ncbi:MAG: hypothetical protein ABI411_11920 [Tahibacter sp.]
MARYRGRRCQWLILWFSVGAGAQEAASLIPSVDAPPSAELLQYLDEFTDDAGEFTDPEDVATRSPNDNNHEVPSIEDTDDEAVGADDARR